MERDIMTIDKNNEGAWRICENINGYLETQVYYFYTKKDAIKKFKEYKKNLINQQKGTMKNKKNNYQLDNKVIYKLTEYNWIFDKKMSEYQYCKTFWGLTEKNELKKNVFWDNWESNAIKVHSQKEITNEQVKILNELGVA